MNLLLLLLGILSVAADLHVLVLKLHGRLLLRHVQVVLELCVLRRVVIHSEVLLVLAVGVDVAWRVELVAFGV